ncbi:MAG: caspase family protein, partial [Nanoarchaeota archaeon]|nr:caspase family protein [Nanoarchaeota archaeon]
MINKKYFRDNLKNYAVIEGKHLAETVFMHDTSPIMTKKKNRFPFNRIFLLLICLLLLSTNMLFQEINNYNYNNMGIPGRIIITSCAENEVSYGDIFSLFFNKGLIKKEADNNSNGWVSAEEAFYYAKTEMPEYFDKYTDIRGTQTPQIYDGIEGDVELRCIHKTNKTTNINRTMYAAFVGIGSNSVSVIYEIYDVLLKYCSFNPMNIRVLTDTNATKINIENNITWLAHNTKPGDAVIMYFSGHGGHGCIYVYDDTITKQ